MKGCDSKAEIDLMLEEIRFYRKQLGAQEDAFRKVRDEDKLLLGGLDKVRYTKEGIEALIYQAEQDQDADQFVVNMKVTLLLYILRLLLRINYIIYFIDCGITMVDESSSSWSVILVISRSSSIFAS